MKDTKKLIVDKTLIVKRVWKSSCDFALSHEEELPTEFEVHCTVGAHFGRLVDSLYAYEQAFEEGHPPEDIDEIVKTLARETSAMNNTLFFSVCGLWSSVGFIQDFLAQAKAIVKDHSAHLCDKQAFVDALIWNHMDTTGKGIVKHELTIADMRFVAARPTPNFDDYANVASLLGDGSAVSMTSVCSKLDFAVRRTLDLYFAAVDGPDTMADALRACKDAIGDVNVCVASLNGEGGVAPPWMVELQICTLVGKVEVAGMCFLTNESYPEVAHMIFKCAIKIN